jgi:nuclear GTP-binding protein
VDTEPFSDTFGPKSQRKKARIDASDFQELAQSGAAAAEEAALAADATGAGVLGMFEAF